MVAAVTAKFEGPLFEPDIAVRFTGELSKDLDVVALGVQRAWQVQMYPGHGVKTGRYRGDISPAATGQFTREVGTAVEYAGFVTDGTRFFEGYHFTEHVVEEFNAGEFTNDLEEKLTIVLGGT